MRLLEKCLPFFAPLGLVLLLLSMSSFVLLAEDATFELTKDVPTAVKLMADAISSGDTDGERWGGYELIHYGNWYGPGWWGGTNEGGQPGNRQPVDALDAVAMKHDFAYEYAQEQGKLHGKEYEYLLKAMADEIAVREARALPKDPTAWNPPAADPDTASRYRDRIQFGFSYWAKKHQLQGDAATVASAFKYLITRQGLPQISEAELQAEVNRRTADWYDRNDVRPMYRFEFTSPGALIAEGQSVTISGRVVPVENRPSATNIAAIEAQLALTAVGPGDLSSSTISSGLSVVLTASTPYFFTNNGDKIKVEATFGGDAFDLATSAITFTVAAITNMSLSVSPDVVDTWSEDPPARILITFRAKLADTSGNGIAGMPIEFVRADGARLSGTTGSDGIAAVSTVVEKSILGSAASLTETWTARMTSTTSPNGTQYFPSTASAFLTLNNKEIITIRGVVYDERRGNPLEGATVEIDAPGGTLSTTTSSSGQFVFQINVGSGPLPAMFGSVTKSGYAPGTFTLASLGGSYGGSQSIRIAPLEATVTGRVVDAETKGLLDGSTVRVAQPFDTLIFTEGGRFTITGLYVGDTLTMTAGAFNHKGYTKSGTITMESASVTFNLPPGEGDSSGGGLDATENEGDDESNLPIIHSLMVWASPASPGPFQSVIVTAQIFPPEAGVLLEISMQGTDGYTTSTTAMTNAMGKVFLHIPGASSGVVDDVIARIIGERVRVVRQLKYSF
ncbi:hypothetical protein KKG90_11480 [Candidatus Bipolaricaulota bacterium]|nr:hypothetical protein [Candidatus Bipolaricaulota bacterium]